ncbi:hypothetical protein [Aliarcobacter butzleri]|jgi:hypothetical protein|uniref:Antitoxin n=1 Tax=Aliarcobacter butzleri TaxID=28197 RepID=A0AAP4Q0V9_9BACT|nr:hypothetical protein [Aliarcobacter butzleri]MBF7071060.1 hypothetical protein [Aliarcobacter butzleri]MCG3667373.1 hypothetical protein [Aliarcobacter butzleri]MCG3676261.1 hypothetical protein [Aliarcobacter butzleri]MCG3681342.1 hypothetical protein [Aliarcobacter butzleri]MCG3688972.1 hypothetical protein [Aliarcobacter butzleri]
MQKTKILSQETFQKDMELYFDKLKNKDFKKIVLKSEDEAKNDVVILRVDDYERLKNLCDFFEDLPFVKINI